MDGTEIVPWRGYTCDGAIKIGEIGRFESVGASEILISLPSSMKGKTSAFDNTCSLLIKLALYCPLALCTDFSFATKFLMILSGWAVSNSLGLSSNVGTAPEKIKTYILKIYITWR